MSATCTQPTTVLGIARAGASAQAFLVESAAISAGATTALTGPWATPAQFTATFENLPPSVTRAIAYATSRVGTSVLYLPLNELPPPSGGATTGTFPVPPAFGDGTELGYFVGRGFEAYQRGFTSVSGARTMHTFDGSALLPWIETLASSYTQTSWTVSDGDSYDGTLVTFDFQYKNSTVLTWRVILPASARSIVLPSLPSDIQLPVDANDSVVNVELSESDAFDYTQMRATAGATSFRRDDTLPAQRTLRSSSR